MPDAVNPFLSFFLLMMKRQFQFLAVVGAATVFFAFFAYGANWITFGIVFATALTLGMFYALTWFWRGVLQSGLNRGN